MLEAHGLGGAADLPIPASYAIIGGSAALVLSFVILLIAWRRPRFDPPGPGRPAPSWAAALADSPVTQYVCGAAGMLVLGFWLFAALAGPDQTINPVFGMLYAWLWTGIVPVSLMLGPYIRMFSPARTLHRSLMRLMDDDPRVGFWSYPDRMGYWPASLGLFAFVWIELVYPEGTFLGPVILWVAIYFACMLVGSVAFGDVWFTRADPFEVYSSLIARLSPWGRAEDGALIVRSPLRNLATLPPTTGLVAVVGVLLGSTAFDSFRGSVTWFRFLQRNNLGGTEVPTLMLIAACLVVMAILVVSARTAGRVAGVKERSELPTALAHSIVPIIVGYMVAHYLTFFVETGQDTLIKASDPLANGANLFGTAGWNVNYWISQHPSQLASTKVIAIVTGHVVGVIAAHDRALSKLGGRHFMFGQLPLLLGMTLYTWAGLYLLFGA